MKYVIEFEGFALSKTFVFKEATIRNLNTEFRQWFWIRPPFNFQKLTNKEKRIVRYCERKIHKLSWSSGTQSFNNFCEVLKTIKDDDIVFTKGLQKANILSTLIPSLAKVYDLDDFQCPKYFKEFNSKVITTCPLEMHKDSEHCSYKKAHFFVDFIKTYNEFKDSAELGFPF